MNASIPISKLPTNAEDPYDYPHVEIPVTSSLGTHLLLPLNYTADLVYIAEINGLHARYDTHETERILEHLFNEGHVMKCVETYKCIYTGKFLTQNMYRAVEP